MVNYGVSGSDRKRLVKALESITGERAVYQGMPSMSYKVGEYIVSKTGEVSGAELSDEYKEALSNAGFIPACESDDPEPAGIVISISREGLSDNPRYSFRVYLNSLGFTGSDHKELRTELLKNLTGSTAWRHGKPQRMTAGGKQN